MGVAAFAAYLKQNKSLTSLNLGVSLSCGINRMQINSVQKSQTKSQVLERWKLQRHWQSILHCRLYIWGWVRNFDQFAIFLISRKDCAIGIDGVTEIVRALLHNSSLRTLDLTVRNFELEKSNKLNFLQRTSIAGFDAFQQVLVHNSTLTELRLRVRWLCFILTNNWH